MFSTSTKRVLTHFALAMQLVVAFIPSSGLLLCFGADGHFEVEATHEGRACHDVPGYASENEGCRDIALVVSPVAERPSLRAFASDLPILFATQLLPSAPLPSSEQSLPESPALDCFTREALRSVILLV